MKKPNWGNISWKNGVHSSRIALKLLRWLMVAQHLTDTLYVVCFFFVCFFYFNLSASITSNLCFDQQWRDFCFIWIKAVIREIRVCYQKCSWKLDCDLMGFCESEHIEELVFMSLHHGKHAHKTNKTKTSYLPVLVSLNPMDAIAICDWESKRTLLTLLFRWERCHSSVHVNHNNDRQWL